MGASLAPLGSHHGHRSHLDAILCLNDACLASYDANLAHLDCIYLNFEEKTRRILMVFMLACSSISTQFRRFFRLFCCYLGSSYAHLWHPWTLLGTSWPSLGPSWGHLRSHHGRQALILMPYCASLLPACFHINPTCSTSALSRHPRLQF